MGKCEGHHHTSMCSFKCILLCLLFHIHIHSCHGADLDSTAPPQWSQANPTIGTDNNTDVVVAVEQNEKPVLKPTTPVDHVNFLQKIFQRYGDGKHITYEGFEHLLNNLGLAELHIHDHYLKQHFVNGSFRNIHQNHNHSDHHINSTSNIELLQNTSSSDNYDHLQNDQDSEHLSHNHADKPYNLKDNITHIHHRSSFSPLSSSNDSSHPTNIRSHMHKSENIRHSKAHGIHRKRRWLDNASILESQEYDSVTITSEKRTISLNYVNDKCYSADKILENYNIVKFSVITEETFLQICPALLYQLETPVCSTHNGANYHDDHANDHDDHQHIQNDDDLLSYHNHQNDDHDNHQNSSSVKKTFWNTSLSVWGYAFLSVLVISLVGLLSVAVIPLTTKVFYNHLLQFLVALAVGSLTGDACLHLLPHALSPHKHSDENPAEGHYDDDDGHNHGPSDGTSHSLDAVWKGLVVLSGIYFFFLMERIMGLVTAKTRRHNKEKRDISPQIYKPIKDKEKEIGAKLSGQTTKVMSCEEILMVVHPSKDLRNLAEDAHDEVHENCEMMDEEQVQGYSQSHGHSHHHGPLPSSVSSVAWMVIMGDGMHNFSDGLAIGAAYANSLTGGLSTSVAVLCHELPHELGDFAVLLRAGMRPKQAIVYNLVSSILCLFGMIVGVAVGNLSQASLWIFALIAGSFIYIALVDMLPEITSVDPKAGEHPLVHLLLQNMGLLTGAAIMLVIAIYEDQIKIPQWEP